MQESQESIDIVQDLYDEIEHLIDIPFSFDNNTKIYEPIIQNKDFHYKYDIENDEESEYQHADQVKHYPEEQEQSNNDGYNKFERPILIESDSDDIEEELINTRQDNICYKCHTNIPASNSLSVTDNMSCLNCSTKYEKNNNKKVGKRPRSSSFTFTLLADKLKSSFGHSSSPSNNFLSPSTKNIDRRKSMPTMNSIFNTQPSNDTLAAGPTPSRPSSRASSFIEDMKQFLAPLSRKTSRSSLHSDYQQSNELKKKSSHQSLINVINICKPLKPTQSPSYERRIIQQWSQEDKEAMGVHTKSDTYQHITIRRKQINQVESLQDRINIYNNAYLQCMSMETDLVPWIIKQTQKGPPDDWFGYVPPVREPKKVLGIFKRKSKVATDLRSQQQQLGDELLNRSTPLLQQRYSSNSNLSGSPCDQSYSVSSPDSYLTTSPSTTSHVNYEEEETREEYFDDRYTSPMSVKNQLGSTSPLHNYNHHTEEQSVPQKKQPVSILKKANSDINMHQNYNGYNYENQHYDDHYDDYNKQQRQQEDGYYEEEDDDEYYRNQYYAVPQSPPPASTRHYQKRRPSSMEEYHYNNTNGSSGRRLSQQQLQKRYTKPPTLNRQVHMSDYPPQPPPMMRGADSSYSSTHDRDDYYHYNSSTKPVQKGYNDSITMNKKKRNSRQYYQREEQQEEEEVYSYNQEDYYGLSVKLTPYMMEEWEIALDDLCDLYPRLDRRYINDFLRSAQGDFVTAKNMIMEMITEIR